MEVNFMLEELRDRRWRNRDLIYIRHWWQWWVGKFYTLSLYCIVEQFHWWLQSVKLLKLFVSILFNWRTFTIDHYFTHLFGFKLIRTRVKKYRLTKGKRTDSLAVLLISMLFCRPPAIGLTSESCSKSWRRVAAVRVRCMIGIVSCRPSHNCRSPWRHF